MKKIIWINGTFGVGKTTVSKILKEKLVNYVVLESDEYFRRFCNANPNEAIFGGTMPQNKIKFLEYFKQIINSQKNNIIVVMALTTDESRAILLENTKAEQVFHFIIEADKETILERINKDYNRDKEFAKYYIDSGIAYLEKHYSEAVRIDSTDKSPEDVAQMILENLSNG